MVVAVAETAWAAVPTAIARKASALGVEAARAESVGVALVRSKSFVVVWPREEIGGGSSAIARKKLAQGFQGVESCDLLRAVQRVADVVEPDDLAIG